MRVVAGLTPWRYLPGGGRSAFPATWSVRLRGAGVGLVVIAAFNTVRIGNLSLMAANRPLHTTSCMSMVWPAILDPEWRSPMLNAWMRSGR